MQAQVWTLISVLSASMFGLAVLFFAGYQHLGARIDAQGLRIDGQPRPRSRVHASKLASTGSRRC